MDRLVRRLVADRASGRAAARPAEGARPSPVAPVAPTAPVPAAPVPAAPVAPVALVAAVAPVAALGVESGVGPEPLCPVRAAREVLTRPVRRRGKELENAIFEAVLDQLTSGGYARLTMEGVAAAARTGKAALYRRWASKVDLVVDALDATLPRPHGTPDLGAARAELLQLIGVFAEAMGSPAGTALHALMGELSQQQAQVFKDFIVQRVVEPIKETILDILRRGVERGDVRPGAVTPLVADVVPAMLMFQVKACGQDRLPPDFAVRLVDDVLVPLIRQP
ncbi:TetR-like C-terminal domain-containing protein [Streptomyces sp. FH025]|uniref:TetR-like C-terminal domain-containing protein n=1 Tax=Streptomyces sp. FH025 TaxID=2815937 RepID=UPI001A9F3F41|nr:TetR-like C-terminal domain-containing protein [Streptomyces sp. FH025]MBO1417724.1 TetR/AcrR family transcriptional regulator C-terminal ligand-binding domain-containing protein [Streptomyces sp. FH025]